MSERTITLSEFKRVTADYGAAYERGETFVECAFCWQPVVEKIAEWSGGDPYHSHCAVWFRLHYLTSYWFELAWNDYLTRVLDRFGGVNWHYGDTQSYRALTEKNAREHPDDEFFQRDPFAGTRFDAYMDLAVICMGLEP